MRRTARVLLYAALGATALVFLLPLGVMLLTSFKSMDDIRRGNLVSWPEAFTLAAWTKAWSEACVGADCVGVRPFFVNSLRMAIPSVLISTFIGSLNGYALSQWRFRGSDALFSLAMIGCFLPFQIVILPMAQLLGKAGLAGTLTGLVFVHVVYGLAFTTLFFRNYYVLLPPELLRAARIDGAGFFATYARILLPLSKPIFAVTIIWQFTQIWNDFLFGVVFSAGGQQPITVALNNIVNTSTGLKEYNVHMASAFFAALPTLAVYVLGGKYFIRGLMSGAVKG